MEVDLCYSELLFVEDVLKAEEIDQNMQSLT